MISAFAIAALVLAYLIRGIAGFGSGLVAISLLALERPLVEVVPLVLLLDWLASMVQGGVHREAIRWGEVVALLPAHLIGVGVALWVFRLATPDGIEQAFGLFIVAFAAYQVLPLRPLSGSRLWALPLGGLGGLVGTLFGTGGPFFVVFASLRQLDKSALRATLAAILVLEGTIRIAGLASVGHLDTGTLGEVMLCLPWAAAGLAIGTRLHVSLSPSAFRWLISTVLGTAGWMLLVR